MENRSPVGRLIYAAQKALVKSKQSLVYFKNIILLMLYEILDDNIKLIAVRQRKSGFHQHFCRVVDAQLESNTKSKNSRLRRFI